MTVRRTRIACCVTKATETHSEYVISYLLLFHGNSGYANARHCYILRTLPVLFVKAMLGCKGAVKLHHVVDIDIISRSRKSLQEVTVALDRAARMMGLEINQAKTKYMICGNKKRNVKNVSNVKHVTFERVNSFEYPRTLITNRNDNSAEINNTRVGTLIMATIHLQLIQNRYMFRSFTVLQCSHQHCVQPIASDVEVVRYL